MPPKHWHLPATDLVGRDELAGRLGVSPILAGLLIARGLGTESAARRFLDPQLDHLHPPSLLPDIGPATERLARAVRERAPILIYGDYDVDGVCAAALLARALRALKADVRAFVPHRQVEGYDLQPEAVRRAAAEGIRLIVTADCGIVAFHAAETARELGVDLIVTDHHEPDPEGRLPAAVAVVDPKRADSRYPFREICGTGVAYKVAEALVERLGLSLRSFRTRFLDLVALATCADCVPLVDENRVFVRFGLETLRQTNKAGLKALMEVAALKPRALDARSLGFVLGPRINAIGRLDAAQHALRLLLTGDAAEARSLAERLDQANRERQAEQDRILAEAVRQAERSPDDPIVFLASPRWHPGVIGIVAGKLAESLCRPTILVAIDEESLAARGSCRSVEGFDIFEALDACRRHLLRCGGHHAAAGFEAHPDELPALRDALQRFAAGALSATPLQPSLRVDLEVPPEAVDLRLAREVALLAPFGHGNPEPIFLSRGLHVLAQMRLPARSNGGTDHLKLRLGLPGSQRSVEAVYWQAWPRAGECARGTRLDVCYTLGIREYAGYPELEVTLQDFRPAEACGSFPEIGQEDEAPGRI